MNKFLLKINENDRDCVKYLDTEGTGAFECGHYFAGLRISGACFSGSLKEIKEQNFENITTILTEEELKRLFEFNEKISELGCGIVQGDERYQKGLEYRDRGIICGIWRDIDECAYDEADSMGYVNRNNDRYFNYETFGEDLLNSENYLELEDGRVVMLSY